MRKIFSIAFTLILGTLYHSTYAAPGDTTWVQANDVQLNYYNNFDEEVSFPDDGKTYRKVLMYFILGKYNCPSSEQYCHQWDYTVQNFLLTETDTIELTRFITPFATSGWSRFNGDWKQPYIFDVTNFEPLLRGDAVHRIHYSGYSGGFTANVKFAFIEGTPDRDVVGIEKVYNGSFQYGNPANPIDNHFPEVTLTTPDGTASSELKVLITGHGYDNYQCCEFRPSNYQVRINDEQIVNQAIWKDDCGLNQLYPQGGTWIYDRANWCPGEKVFPNYHKLNAVNSSNTEYDLKINFNNYTGGGDWGSYTVSATVFYYGDFNKIVDASLEEIVSPTTNVDYYRNNPGGTQPEVIVKNTGATPITSISFEYGVTDSLPQQYTWTGNIASLQTQHILLEELTALKNMSYAGLEGEFNFHVSILKVNGETDEDSTNDALESKFVVAPTWPGMVVIDFKTSNIGANGNLNSNPADASWEITDLNGNVIFSRTNNQTDTSYGDTLIFSQTGFYKLTIKTVACGGLYWWAYNSGWSGYKSGHFKPLSPSGSLIPMKDYKYSGQQRNDFGCEFVHYFTVPELWETLGLNDLELQKDELLIYPNPADEYFIVELGNLPTDGEIQLYDLQGQVVYQNAMNQNQLKVSTTNLSHGVYSLIYATNNQQFVKKIVIK